MADEIRDRAHEGLSRLGTRGRTTRIPDEVRAAVLAYVARERSRGRSSREVADELGLSSGAVARWKSGRRRVRGKIVPVRVVTAPAVSHAESAIRIVTPSGYRIEGLSVRDAVEVIRAIE